MSAISIAKAMTYSVATPSEFQTGVPTTEFITWSTQAIYETGDGRDPEKN